MHSYVFFFFFNKIKINWYCNSISKDFKEDLFCCTLDKKWLIVVFIIKIKKSKTAILS